MGEKFINEEAIEDYLFDITLLRLALSKDGIPSLPDGYHVRPLHVKDSQKGYLELLKYAAYPYQMDMKRFLKKFHWLRSTQFLPYYIVVVENNRDRVIATVTLVMELKFIHGLGARGRVKDLIVDVEHRNLGIGKVLGLHMVELARHLGAYKVTLGCADNLISFFERCGYIKDIGNNVMCCELDGRDEEKSELDIVKLGNSYMSQPLYEVDNEMLSGSVLNALTLNKAPKLPENLRSRSLHIKDWERGFLDLLEQLTTVGKISETEFIERFRLLQNSSLSRYFILVIEDIYTQRVVGSGTLFVDLHGSSAYGHVEDIVVDAGYRGRKLGHFLNISLLELAHKIGISHLSLECRDRLLTFYQHFGYEKNGTFMVCRFNK